MATMDDLAQTVLTAVTGKDVRNAMAQAISQWDSAKGDVFERLEAIEAQLNEVSDQVKQLQEELKQLGINTEYITDTDINTDNTIDAPTSIMVNDGGNGDELSGLTIEEQKGEN